MTVEFAVFLPRTKSFNVLAIYGSRAYRIWNRYSQNDGWRTRCTRAASYFIDLSSRFPYICTENEKELTPRGAWQ